MPVSSATLATLRDEIRFRVNPDVGSDLNARIDTRINWSISNLVQIVRPPEFEATDETQVLSPTSRVVALPTDWLANITVKVLSSDTQSADYPLDPMSENDEENTDESETGQPRLYLRYGLAMYVYPKPSDAFVGLTVRNRYLKAPKRLVDVVSNTVTETAISPLPDYLDEAIILSSAARMLRDMEEVERANACVGQLRLLLDTAIHVRGTEVSIHGLPSMVLVPDNNLI